MQRRPRAFLLLASWLLLDAARAAATEHHPLVGTAQVNRGKAGYVPAPPPAEPVAVPRLDLPAHYVGEPPPAAPAPAAPTAPVPPPPPEPSAPALGTNFQGITYTNFFPPDPTMAAGPSELLLTVNGGVRLFTLILVMLAVEFLILLSFQNFLRSALSGKVSIKMAMVWPFPVSLSPSALYAFMICDTRKPVELFALLDGPAAPALPKPGPA